MPCDLLEKILDLLFPRVSLRGSDGQWITEHERKEILSQSFPLKLDRSMLRSRGIQCLDEVIAGAMYDQSPLLQKAIRTFKYHRIPGLHADLSAVICKALPLLYSLPKSPDKNQIPVLCAVPLHWSRRFARGFNQSQLLAQDISMHRYWPLKTLLKRTRATGHQAHRNREKRLSALTDAFRYIGPSTASRHVILIDDLCTTGATLQECAKALKKAGVKRVEAFVVAYG